MSLPIPQYDESLKAEFIASVIKKYSLDSKMQSELKQVIQHNSLDLCQAPQRLGICSEDQSLQLFTNISGYQTITNNAQIPIVQHVLDTILQLELNLDWCIANHCFVVAEGDAFKVLVDTFDKSSILSVVWSQLSEITDDTHVSYLLVSSAMINTIVDELERERDVRSLLSSKSISAAAMAEEAPIINLVNSIIDKAIEDEASDIHIEAGETFFNIRLRVDGNMHLLMQQPMSRFSAVASRIKLMSELDIAERRLPQDGRFTAQGSGSQYDVRVSTAPDVHGESIVMRLLPKKRDELSLDYLGFETDHLAQIRKWAALSNGIVLVTGPTGSGKSTTLYGLLSDIKTGNEKIVTVEDPVEFQLEGITQVQARADIGYTFAKALRTFLRQDPDIIMVGEIRDKETAEIAVQSSLTGHLVLSTLHTNDACSVFPRLADIGVERYLVAATIRGVQAQRLVRKLCDQCAEPASAPAFLNTEFEHNNWRSPVGCEACSQKGYKGRVGIYELIEVSSSLRELISNSAELDELKAQAKKDGARFLLDDGLLKASKGITSVDEVLRVCSRLSEG